MGRSHGLIPSQIPFWANDEARISVGSHEHVATVAAVFWISGHTTVQGFVVGRRDNRHLDGHTSFFVTQR